MAPRRRTPKHLITCWTSGRQHNARIREIVRRLAESREADIGVIYRQLNLIVLETLGSDQEWEQIEFETREAIRAENERKTI